MFCEAIQNVNTKPTVEGTLSAQRSGTRRIDKATLYH
jgi:hypothetical protein